MEKRPQRTAQRLAILDFVKDNKSHPSIKDIYEHVSDKLSNISLTTIYNTMELLKKEGVVFELPMLGGEGRRFDSNPILHDHLVCKSCGSVHDVDVDVDHSLLISESQKKGFEIKKICINIYGICPQCKNLGNENNINL